MGQSMFIVWRESVEALLVIGILHAWLRQQPGAGNALRMLWAGVAAGLGRRAGLGRAAGRRLAGRQRWRMVPVRDAAGSQPADPAHGRLDAPARPDPEDQPAEQRGGELSQGSGFGLLVLAMLAVGREGSETVVFLYGIGNQQQGQDLTGFVIGGSWASSSPAQLYRIAGRQPLLQLAALLPGQRGDVAAARWRPADGRAGPLQRPADGHGCTGSVLYGVRRSALGHLRPAG